MKKEGFVRDWLVWFIAFLIGIIIVNYLTKYLGYINFPNNVILLNLYYGFIIELCSKIMQFFIFNRRIKFNVRFLINFLFWIVIQAAVFWAGSTLIKTINWLDFLVMFGYLGMRYEFAFRVLFVATIQVILVRLIWLLKIESKFRN